jgi:hypothetical protein
VTSASQSRRETTFGGTRTITGSHYCGVGRGGLRFLAPEAGDVRLDVGIGGGGLHQLSGLTPTVKGKVMSTKGRINRLMCLLPKSGRKVFRHSVSAAALQRRTI